MQLLKQDKILRRSVVILLATLLVWFLVAHTTLLAAWTLDGSPASLSQIHAWCSTTASALVSAAGNATNASACASSSDWWAFAGFLEGAMVAAVVMIGFRVYRANFGKHRPTQVPMPPVQPYPQPQPHPQPLVQPYPRPQAYQQPPVTHIAETRPQPQVPSFTPTPQPPLHPQDRRHQ